MRSVEVRYPPPPRKGCLSDTCAIPYENKAKRVRYPPLRYYLERVLRDMGGISRWAAKGSNLFMFWVSFGEKREKHIQMSQEILEKCRDNPGIILGQSREHFVYVFSRLLFFWPRQKVVQRRA